MKAFAATILAVLLATSAQANSYYDYVAQQNDIKNSTSGYVRSWNMTTLRNVVHAKRTGVSVRSVYTQSGRLVGYQIGGARFYNAYSYSYSGGNGADSVSGDEYPTHGDD